MMMMMMSDQNLIAFMIAAVRLKRKSKVKRKVKFHPITSHGDPEGE